MATRTFALSAAALIALLWAGSAVAQSPLSEGRTRLELADFEGAVIAFDRVEAATSGLTRAELVELYALRSSANLALGRDAAMDADLRHLAALDPGHAFGPATRPEVHEAFQRVQEAAGQPLSVSAAPQEEPGGVRIEGRARGDSEGLVRTVRVHGRVAAGEWREGDGQLTLPATEGAGIEYYVEAVGPGGAVVATEGLRGAPQSYEVTGILPGGSGGDVPLDGDGAGDDRSNAVIWIAVIGGVAAVALIAVMIGLAVGGTNDTTNPAAPMVYP